MIFTAKQKSMFSKEVESFIKDNGGTYIDAVISLCENYEIEPPLIAKSLSKPLIEKIKMEGQDLNLLPKPQTQLPI